MNSMTGYGWGESSHDGLKVTVEPRSLPTVRYAFVEDPNGILIEFIQTLKP